MRTAVITILPALSFGCLAAKAEPDCLVTCHGQPAPAPPHVCARPHFRTESLVLRRLPRVASSGCRTWTAEMSSSRLSCRRLPTSGPGDVVQCPAAFRCCLYAGASTSQLPPSADQGWRPARAAAPRRGVASRVAGLTPADRLQQRRHRAAERRHTDRYNFGDCQHKRGGSRVISDGEM